MALKLPNQMQNKILNAFFLLFCLVFFIHCDHNLKGYGSAKMTYTQNSGELDVMEIWPPYGYYFIEFSAFFSNNQRPRTAGKGWSRGTSFFGSYHWKTNHFSSNDLSIDEVNRRLEKIELEKPLVFWIRDVTDSKGNRSLGLHIILISKNKDIFESEEALLDLAKKLSPIPIPEYKLDY